MYYNQTGRNIPRCEYVVTYLSSVFREGPSDESTKTKHMNTLSPLKCFWGNSFVFQWLGLDSFTAEGSGSVPGGGPINKNL